MFDGGSRVMHFVSIDEKTTAKLGGVFNEKFNYGVLGFDPNDNGVSHFGIGCKINNGIFVEFKFLDDDCISKNKVVIAYNIDWDVDVSEITEALDSMRVFDAAKKVSKVFGISESQYVSMHTNERHNAIHDAIHRSPGKGDDFFHLPEAVLVPKEVYTAEAEDSGIIADWISDQYGFCVRGFNLSTDLIQAA